jgi:hypothetical protein
MNQKMDNLSLESNDLRESITKIRQEATETREVFVSDIAQVLSDSRNIKSLRTKMKELQRKLHHAESYEFDLKETRKRLKELEKTTWEQLSPPHGTAGAVAGGGGGGAALTPRKVVKKFLFHLEDKILLEIFAFLETQDVLRAAQVEHLTDSPLLTLSRSRHLSHPPGLSIRVQESRHLVRNRISNRQSRMGNRARARPGDGDGPSDHSQRAASSSTFEHDSPASSDSWTTCWPHQINR